MTMSILWVIGSIAGCASTRQYTFTYRQDLPQHVRTDADRIARDPGRFLQETLQRCQSIDHYETEFFRQERLGLLIKNLRPEERLRVLFSREPLSVRMDFLNPDSDFKTVAYVEGQNRNKMRCRWRQDHPGSKPNLSDFSPQASVQWGKSQTAITEFGIERLMQRILDFRDRATSLGLAPQVQYVGVAEHEKNQSPVHHIQLRYDPKTNFPRLKIDLHIDANTLLPAACYCWLADGELDAKYIYTNLTPQSSFEPNNFQIP